jgi:hypothetical protein
MERLRVIPLVVKEGTTLCLELKGSPSTVGELNLEAETVLALTPLTKVTTPGTKDDKSMLLVPETVRVPPPLTVTKASPPKAAGSTIKVALLRVAFP